ncbi:MULTISPECIES: hypothetical protein [Francisella]|uniref:Uncharacterized protein n=1 Tax=Francisella opportunistica TaxID=2016517 RepID=A0A345JTD4_9GAMM|nr:MULTISPECIES: hypothetical protein [Francisella]APC92375.1 hypothetical protein BBG19_1649 [Francisella sp. MA067296]AXH30580.1 hypothetical protein CGC43_08335 [Francisella opportunistica]AXH32221.1 hypothetical protein CGC44_08310 [Francisella opportunistica]AXH33870.1 hypothetical protein CGC45_08370 [Francisella opportunistica]
MYDVAKYLCANSCNIAKEQLSKDVKFYVTFGFKRVYLSSASKKIKVVQWHELWSVDGCGQNYSFPITFTGDGVGGTYWSILKLILLNLQNLNSINISEVDIKKIYIILKRYKSKGFVSYNVI